MGLKDWVVGLRLELPEAELVGQCYPRLKLVG